MRVANTEQELEDYLELAAKVSREHPVVVSKFIGKAKEVEVDGVSDGESSLVGAIIEHVENAGVHSGDATMCIPPQTLPSSVLKTIEDYAHKIAKALKIKGPYNIQFLVKNGVVSVIECNLRASRSMPYVSKTRGMNLIELATSAMLGIKLNDDVLTEPPPMPHVGVKVSQFSFMRLSGADPVLGVEMLSTGEVACLGESFADAFLKASQSAEFRIPPNGGAVLITVSGDELKKKIAPLAKSLAAMGFKIYATEHTAQALRRAGLVGVSTLYKVREVDKNPNILDYLRRRKIDLVINIPTANGHDNGAHSDIVEDGYIIRRTAVEFNVPVVTNLELASALTSVLKQRRDCHGLTVRSLNEYMSSLAWNTWEKKA
jgi:carbamoyl-phosphate synthase large subunit